MACARQARREGVNMNEPVVEPPLAARRLKPGGYGPVSNARSPARATPYSHNTCGCGGHREELRRTGGEVAGEKLDTAPVNRLLGERGNHLEVVLETEDSGERTGALSAEGVQAGRSLRSSLRSGKPVTRITGLYLIQDRPWIIRGKGRQQVRSCGTGRSGGRR